MQALNNVQKEEAAAQKKKNTAKKAWIDSARDTLFTPLVDHVRELKAELDANPQHGLKITNIRANKNELNLTFNIKSASKGLNRSLRQEIYVRDHKHNGGETTFIPEGQAYITIWDSNGGPTHSPRKYEDLKSSEKALAERLIREGRLPSRILNVM